MSSDAFEIDPTTSFRTSTSNALALSSARAHEIANRHSPPFFVKTILNLFVKTILKSPHSADDASIQGRLPVQHQHVWVAHTEL
jgi:hypothetical protein